MTDATSVSAWLATLGGSGWTTNEPAPGVAPFSPVLTRATLPAASAVPKWCVFISDVGVGGSYWFSDGSRWRPLGGRCTLKNLVTEISNSAGAKIVLDSVLLPGAGLFVDGDVIRTEYTKQRAGGTSDTDATDIMIGTAAATLGTSVGLTNSGLATTNIEIDVRAAFRKVSATSVRPLSLTGSLGFGIGAAASVAATVPNMDTQDTYLQITSDLTTAGGEVAWLRAWTVELVAGS